MANGDVVSDKVPEEKIVKDPSGAKDGGEKSDPFEALRRMDQTMMDSMKSATLERPISESFTQAEHDAMDKVFGERGSGVTKENQSLVRVEVMSAWLKDKQNPEKGLPKHSDPKDAEERVRGYLKEAVTEAGRYQQIMRKPSEGTVDNNLYKKDQKN